MLRMQAWRRESAEKRLFYRIAAGTRTDERVQSREPNGERRTTRATVPAHPSGYPLRCAYSTASQRVPGRMSGYNRAGRATLAIRLSRRLTSHHSISDHRMPRKKQALTVEDLWSLKRIGT